MSALEERHLRAAAAARRAIERGLHDPPAFRAALLGVPAGERDAWVDLVLGLDDLPPDGPALPPGGVPYLPCSVEVLLRTVDGAGVRPDDVFVDVGAGPGRAMALVHLLTGAGAVGLEIQPALVEAARGLASRLGLSRVRCIEGDAAAVTAFMVVGSVFFLNCPFSGQRLAKVLEDLEPIARTRPLRVCCVHLPLPPLSWLAREPGPDGELEMYRSTSSPR
ncbi:MAG TPA: methyltransferase domain-containing protein [Polyangia bacterium]|nr:methyltransferase domain-containing protein [Polyangia bacterium]